MSTTDYTRRTVSAARRMPQWQRLIATIHPAQESAGYAGRHFGAGEIRSFGVSLIGRPVERVGASPVEFAAFWVERQEYPYSDGRVSVNYVVKSVYGDGLANVHTLERTDLDTLTPAADAAAAVDAVNRAHFIAGAVR